MKDRTKSVVALAACGWYAFAAPVAAYIDPGSTSLVLQWIIGGVAAVAVLLGNFWRGLPGMARHVASRLRRRQADSQGKRRGEAS